MRQSKNRKRPREKLVAYTVNTGKLNDQGASVGTKTRVKCPVRPVTILQFGCDLAVPQLPGQLATGIFLFFCFYGGPLFLQEALKF